MLAPVTHILPLTTIRRERLLPSPGKVIVRKGQKVNANDTIAEANLSLAHYLLDVGRGLGLQADRADEHLHVQIGSQVAEGDVVAGPVGLTRRVVRSPTSGRVVLAGSGQILLEVQEKPFQLKAGLSGAVADLIPERGVIMETAGALVQGVWGNGAINYGLLTVVAKEPDQLLTSEQLDVSMRGGVLLAGHLNNREALKAAAELPVRGMILSSMEPFLISQAASMSIPIVVIEGFGLRPMNPAAFKILSTNEKREVDLNAERWDHYAGTRPEVVIPLPTSGEVPQSRSTEVFSPGLRVRVVRAPFTGKTGTLEELVGSAVLPSGVRTMAAEVHLEDGNRAVIPLANLEVLV